MGYAFTYLRSSSGWQKLSSPRNLQEGTPPPSFAAIIKAEQQEYSDKTKYVLATIICGSCFVYRLL